MAMKMLTMTRMAAQAHSKEVMMAVQFVLF
jgi:hypothetical protein